AITDDGRFTALLSFFAVALLTVVVMRSIRDGAWVIASLSLGVLWGAGAMTALSLKLNFVSFAVLPITFGIGVDYAVNLYQRYRQTCSVEDALASSGGAVALCSVTTMIGYATLVTADNQAIQSFGLTAVIGEITCLTAALVALPAVISLRDRRKVASVPALWTDQSRRLALVGLPYLLYALVYDSMRWYADYIRSPIVHVHEPYEFDLRWFGIHGLTPNEWLQRHTGAVLDFFCGLAYTPMFFIGESILLSIWFIAKGQVQDRKSTRLNSSH